MNRIVPEGFDLGPIQSRGIIGDVTEGIHRFILDGWTSDEPPPRIEEDLSFVPKDREQVVYIYMYRAAENQALKNRKRFRPTPFTFCPMIFGWITPPLSNPSRLPATMSACRTCNPARTFWSSAAAPSACSAPWWRGTQAARWCCRK